MWPSHPMMVETQRPLIDSWIRRYRNNNPRSRATYTYVIERNGIKKRVYRSLVNGTKISMCAEYPPTRRVLDWMAEQNVLAFKRAKRSKVCAKLMK